MKDPLFARELRVGDIINGHCDGWLTIKSVKKRWHTRFQNITVVFGNGAERVYSDSDRVDAIRM